MIYLIQYERQSGKLIRIDEFPQDARQKAEETRLIVELDLLRKKMEYEVVLLEASNQAELLKTHRRYFEGIREIFATG